MRKGLLLGLLVLALLVGLVFVLFGSMKIPNDRLHCRHLR